MNNCFLIVFILIFFLFSFCFTEIDEEAETRFPCRLLPRKNFTCAKCIQFHPSCAWCSAKEFDTGDILNSRCDSYKNLLDRGCPETAIEFPKGQGTIAKQVPLSNIGSAGAKKEPLQIMPQELHVTLRKQQIYEFQVTFRQALDYPVDLYYLMDLSQSMLEDKENLAKLGEMLASKMKNISKNFRLGFGSFVDKKNVPFGDPRPEKVVEPCEECVETYGFRNHLSLTTETEKFSKEVRKSRISGNIDAPEGGMEGLMQALVCLKEIGWRNQSRKIIVYSTDAGFHTAGDGRLAGIVVPNDGACYLDGNGYYTKSSEFDYPSIAQMHRKIREQQANLIFAVTDKQLQLYRKFKEALPDLSIAVGKLAKDSSNIVELIEAEYKKISQRIMMVHNINELQGVKISYKTKCKGNKWSETNICEKVRVGDVVAFNVTVQITNCTDKKQFDVLIGPSGFTDALLLKLRVICDCNCSSPVSPSFEAKSTDCNGRGNLVCGTCNCDGDYIGRKCECDKHKGESTSALDAKCKRSPESEICESRGVCNCGVCSCYTRAKPDQIISGAFCECDNFNCPRHERKICGGHGYCDCQQCICDRGWTGPACNCPLSQESCRASNGKICNGHGNCACGVCHCKADAEGRKYEGPSCEICPSCPTKCIEYKPCVMCEQFKSGSLKENECAQCPFTVIPVDQLPDTNCLVKQWNRSQFECQFVDTSDSCTFYFMYEIGDNSSHITVWVKRQKDCLPPVPVTAIVSGVLAGIILFGLLLLGTFKLLTILHDRWEYATFEEEAEGKHSATENPLFRPATTTVTNPTYKAARSKQE